MTDNFGDPTTGRAIALDGRHNTEALQKTVDRLRREVAELRASRERLALAADADRRHLERDLHDGLQQHLVALAGGLELARRSGGSDPEALNTVLDETAHGVRLAFDEAAALAQRIYPPLLGAGGLLAALRAVAVNAGVRTRIDVTADAGCPLELAATVYFCCVEALAHAAADTTVTVRAGDGAITFEVVSDGALSPPDILRDRVEALGGFLSHQPEASGRTRVCGSLPLPQ